MKNNILNESGLQGHIKHLYEDENLTFGDIKNILKLGASGKLKNVTEKVDGQNLFITWRQGKLYSARNKSDVKSGGLDVDRLAQKFSSFDKNVLDTFVNGYQILNKSFSSLDPKELIEIFGTDGNIWFSVEIIFPLNTNVINYDYNAIVFHKFGFIYDVTKNQTISTFNLETNFNKLLSCLPKMQQSINDTNWKLIPPIQVSLSLMNEQTSLINALENLKKIQIQYKLTDNSKIGDFLTIRLENDVLNNLPFSDEVKKLLVARLAGKPGENLQKIKTMVPVDLHPKIDILIKNQIKIKTEALKPLEVLIHDFAVGLLGNVDSFLVNQPDQFLEIIRKKVKTMITQIKSSGNPEDIELLDKQLAKLKSVDNITSSIEGITFQYNGKTYKFNGNFGPINQILGVTKYK